ncbi:MAG: NADH-ubiquinone oxidoreductase-F iron-sulfur binding region domain-containing protein [Acidimicrobiia bacterium]
MFLLPPKPIRSFDEYLATDWGGLGIRRATELGSAETIAEIARSGLRGRGGAGFPTGRKWATVAGASTSDRRFVVCNAAEGEPGTFKDRALLRTNPYQVVEGLIIAANTMGADRAYVCLKASFEAEIAALTTAASEMQASGLCGDCEVALIAGPEEYLFGEEKAMLEVIEGREPLPRILPPYQHGLFATSPQAGWEASGPGPIVEGLRRTGSNPTLVNNAETLANLAPILARGADWFRSLGTAESPGSLIATVVGDVSSPGVAEIELGTPLRRVIDLVGGGPLPGCSIQAVFSGVSNPVVKGDQLDVPMSYEGLSSIGSGLGAGGFVVYDQTACMVEVARVFSRFLSVESCGQCSPCKLGSAEVTRLLERIQTSEADEDEVTEIGAWLAKVTDGARCYLATQEAKVVGSILSAFPDDFVAHLEGSCPRPRPIPIPKLVDLSGGKAVYDERQARKRPDWTYDESR